VHCVANVGLRKRLNLYERGFKIYDLLVYISLNHKSAHCVILRSSKDFDTCVLVITPVTRPFCHFTRVYEGHFMLCYNEEPKVELSNRVMANFSRS